MTERDYSHKGFNPGIRLNGQSAGGGCGRPATIVITPRTSIRTGRSTTMATMSTMIKTVCVPHYSKSQKPAAGAKARAWSKGIGFPLGLINRENICRQRYLTLWLKISLKTCGSARLHIFLPVLWTGTGREGNAPYINCYTDMVIQLMKDYDKL